MTTCYSLEDVLAAADADSQDDQPLGQDIADLAAALLASHRTDQDAA